MIYLDHNASSPVLPEVFEAMRPFLAGHIANPSSLHLAGQQARDAVDHARRQIAELLNCQPDEIIFTSGGTESNNLAILGTTKLSPQPATVLTSSIEHPAVCAPCDELKKADWSIKYCRVHPTGSLDIQDLDRHLTDDVFLLSIMHANNETGVIQPVERVAARAMLHPALFHIDASQSVGKLQIDLDHLRADLLTIAGHKFGAPQGNGALYVRHDTPIEPILYGAKHEYGLRPGTENVASIVGLGRACEIAGQTLKERSLRMQRLRTKLQRGLHKAIGELHITGKDEKRLPNTLHVILPTGDAPTLLSKLPELCISTASACQSSKVALSPTLRAMGRPPQDGRRALRFSIGCTTTDDEIDAALQTIIRAWEEHVQNHQEITKK